MSPRSERTKSSLYHLWLEGVYVLGRLIWFMFLMGIAMIPLNMLISFIAPEHQSQPESSGLDVWSVITPVFFIVYWPFAAIFAARQSKQLLGAK